MKKTLVTYIAIASIALSPIIVWADESSSTTPTRPDGPAIRAQIRANIQTNEIQAREMQAREVQARELKVKQEAEIRARLLNNRASTTMQRMEIRDDRREQVQDIRKDGRMGMMNASNTPERRDIRINTRIEVLKVRRDAMVKQFRVSISNLEQIAGRISTRIDKIAASGKDLSEAKGLLVTALAKIDSAKSAVGIVADYDFSLVNASSTSLTQADLNKVREIGEGAKNAIKESHDALVATVNSVAHSLGVKTETPTNTTNQ